MQVKMLIVTLAVFMNTNTFCHAGNWRSPQNAAVLENTSMTARLQAGILIELTNKKTGISLVNNDVAYMNPNINLFGEEKSRNMDSASISTQVTDDGVVYRCIFPDGASVRQVWKIDKTGDIVLRQSAKLPNPVRQIRAVVPGLDITNHKLVTVTNFGIGTVIKAPFTSKSDLVLDESEQWPDYYYVQPLVALFEGSEGGFVIEGRYKEIGPARILPIGNGSSVDLVLSKLYYNPSKSTELFEVRIRAYKENWHRAVDPFVKWMEDGQGFTPLEKQKPEWISSITGQTYNDPQWDPAGATKKLEDIAKVLVPEKTIIGKTSEWRLSKWGFDHGWGDYSFSDDVRAFFKHASDLGFHQAVHFNCAGIDLSHTDLIKKFEPGLRVMGKNADGSAIYHGYNGEWSNAYGPVKFAWCSHAYQPFNDFMLEQIGKVVEAGADIVYLDEGHTATGKFMIDGKTSIQGLMDFMKQIRTRYPDVAIMTEQFNPAAVKYASFALTSHDLGHPLSGYIYRKYIKVTNWWGQIELTGPKELESYWSWQGERIPGWLSSNAWKEIAQSFQKYDLKSAPDIPLKSHQLAAFRGKNGVIAFAEKTGEGVRIVISR